MAYSPRDSGISLDDFFVRRKLGSCVRDECDAFVQSRYPQSSRPAPFQGYCSYTVIVGDDQIIQFRPPEHIFDIDIATTACRVFGKIVPEVEFLGVAETNELHMYSMRKLEGSSLQDLRAPSALKNTEVVRRQVVRHFAGLQAQSWRFRMTGDKIAKKGTVGSSLQWRIDLMVPRLPDRFKSIAETVQAKLQDIERLPWVVSHGDFIPANVLVCPQTGDITGLLDWAEAEWLPFGVGMYGLEELLGEDVDGRFRYYPEARALRSLFWSDLLSAVPELSQDHNLMQLVRDAQTLGILLWHGIAFDDGSLDRVVEVGVDDREIQRLQAFLLDNSGLSHNLTFWSKSCSSWRNVCHCITRKT